MNAARQRSLLRRGLRLEVITLGWNVVGVVILAVTALRAHSVALAGFGIDSLIEIGASMVVIWELNGGDEYRRQRAMRLIGIAFTLLVLYLIATVTYGFAAGGHAHHTPVGIAWTAVTSAVMLALARGKTRTGRELHNPVLETEGRVTLIDALLAAAVLAGLSLNAALGWWWADPAAGIVIVYYAAREARAALSSSTDAGAAAPAGPRSGVV